MEHWQQGRAEFRRRLLDWLTAQPGRSQRQLANSADVSETTVRRLLEENDSYRGSPENWRKLARHIGMDEAEALELGGWSAPAPLESDPLATIDRELRRLGLGARYLEHIRFQIEVLLRASQSESSGEPSH